MELEKFKASHFDNINELIETCKMWIKDDDYDAYCRFFDMGAMEELIKEITRIKEESIPKAVVETHLKDVNELLKDIDYHDIEDKQEREYYKKEYMQYIRVKNTLEELLKGGIKR